MKLELSNFASAYMPALKGKLREITKSLRELKMSLQDEKVDSAKTIQFVEKMVKNE
eukprot:CAMPEP_0116893328 /NCGR_PEP_ID=MMETSP0467-20121206/3341_1 /TAXON_ID=283647 /ORGANISM="Mesodinium pulex, Strain SPMC105" /LENGTH=55 /DNA_ID=CAMNT_0004562927 /DNA_START=180 /DNA_END=347 /DNA_ORIENTATION=+